MSEQYIIYTDDVISQALKESAFTEKIDTPNYIRKILGLKIRKPPKQQRLTLVLTEQEELALAERFGLCTKDKKLLTQKIRLFLKAFYFKHIHEDM